jgi:hypothetical protein
MKENFVLATGGTKYACQRTVIGIDIQTQTVDVLGVGTKVDPAKYGTGQHSISSMLAVARLIAGEILRK